MVRDSVRPRDYVVGSCGGFLDGRMKSQGSRSAVDITGASLGGFRAHHGQKGLYYKHQRRGG